MASTLKPSGGLILASMQETMPPQITPPWTRPDDAERQARLEAMKRRATGLLAIALLVVVAASLDEAQVPWLGYVRATPEAFLVGGLAGWVAGAGRVRLPLGPPLPHPALAATRTTPA